MRRQKFMLIFRCFSEFFRSRKCLEKCFQFVNVVCLSVENFNFLTLIDLSGQSKPINSYTSFSFSPNKPARKKTRQLSFQWGKKKVLAFLHVFDEIHSKIENQEKRPSKVFWFLLTVLSVFRKKKLIVALKTSCRLGKRTEQNRIHFVSVLYCS